MLDQLNLTVFQINELNALTNNGTQNFYKGYEYITGIVKNDAHVDADTKLWFNRAAEINRNDPFSAANVYIRTTTEAGLSWDGRSYDTQQISDDIAPLLNW